MKVTISKDLYKRIINHARREFPLECCGLISGIAEADSILIKEIYEMRNIDASSEHFSMDPKEQFKVVKAIRDRGYSLVGNYHSHPNTPSRPSEEDIRLAYDPEMIYCIVSLEKEEPVLHFFEIKPSKSIRKLIVNIIEK